MNFVVLLLINNDDEPTFLNCAMSLYLGEDCNTYQMLGKNVAHLLYPAEILL